MHARHELSDRRANPVTVPATAQEFSRSHSWDERKSELLWEVVAVLIPVGIYVLCGLFMWLTPKSGHEAASVLGKPDAFFGACIMFFFAAIHGFRCPPGAEPLAQVPRRGPTFYQIAGLSAGSTCAVAGALSIIFHPIWSMPAGVIAILVGMRLLWYAAFLRSYLDWAVRGRLATEVRQPAVV